MTTRVEPAPFHRSNGTEDGVLVFKQGWGAINFFGFGGLVLSIYGLQGIIKILITSHDIYSLLSFAILTIPLLGLGLGCYMLAFGRSFLRIEKRSQTLQFRQPVTFPIRTKTLPLSDYSQCIVVANSNTDDGEVYLSYTLIIVGKVCENLEVWPSFNEQKMQAIADEINAFVGWPIEKKSTSPPDSANGIPPV